MGPAPPPRVWPSSLTNRTAAPHRILDPAKGPLVGVKLHVLTRKTLRAATQEGLERIVVAGGVACNSGLRLRFQKLAGKQGVRIYFPSPSLCGDNAAMLGVPADYYLENGWHADNKVNAISSWPLDMVGVI